MSPHANPRRSSRSVLLATATGAWELDADAGPLLAALDARGIDASPAVWDDTGIDWHAAELVVVRSTWDYARRREEFLAWADRVAATATLANPVEVLRWNTDKRYLIELADAGVAVVDTLFLEHDEFLDDDEQADHRLATLSSLADAAGEFVVKPSISAGSKDTGRFTASELDAAVELTARIAGQGRTTMAQPYLDTVDEVGETGLVYFDGRFSHAFTKAALLAPGGEADHGLFALERIDPATATRGQRDLGERILDWIVGRFGTVPLYARVDLLTAADGSPVLLELELTEPSWFLVTDEDAPERAAAAIGSRLG